MIASYPLAEKAAASHETQNQAAETAIRSRTKAGNLLGDTLPHEGG